MSCLNAFRTPEEQLFVASKTNDIALAKSALSHQNVVAIADEVRWASLTGPAARRVTWTDAASECVSLTGGKDFDVDDDVPLLPSSEPRHARSRCGPPRRHGRPPVPTETSRQPHILQPRESFPCLPCTGGERPVGALGATSLTSLASSCRGATPRSTRRLCSVASRRRR